MPAAAPLAGRSFGHLTAVEPTESSDARGSVVWFCKCNCGATVLRTRRQLLELEPYQCSHRGQVLRGDRYMEHAERRGKERT